MATFNDVARRWASDDGKKLKAASMSYRGRDGFSWGTLIAVLVESPSGGLVALVTSNRWSDSTSRATGEFRSEAQKADRLVFRVPHLGTSATDHAANLAYFQGQALASDGRIANARKPEIHINEAARIRTTAKAYKEVFGL